MTTINFDLRIRSENQNTYRIEADSLGAHASDSFALSLHEDTLQANLHLIERGQASEAVLIEAGHLLYSALFQPAILALYERARGAAASGDGLRLRLHIEPPELIALPWEYLHDQPDSRGVFLALDRRTQIIRYPEVAVFSKPLKVDGPLRILGVISLPKNLRKLDGEAEQRRIEHALAGLTTSRAVQLHFVHDATWETIQAETLKSYHVLHYIGHGVFEDQGYLAFETKDEQADLVPVEKIGELLQNRPTLRLVLLNACETAATRGANPFLGLAPALIQSGIPAVVAMQYELGDYSAIAFAQGFYTALAEFQPIGVCLTEGRLAIRGRPQATPGDWGIPSLLSRSADGIILQQEKVPEAGQSDSAPQKTTPLGLASAILSLASLLSLIVLGYVLISLNPTALRLAGVALAALTFILGSLEIRVKGQTLKRVWAALQNRRLYQTGSLLLSGLAVVLWVLLGLPALEAFSRDPNADPPRTPMTGDFNIAVADFAERDDNGQLVGSKEGGQISQWLYDRLREEYEASNPGLGVDVDHEGIGLIRSEREAEAIAQEIGAHIILYGEVLESGDVVTFSPHFFVSDLAPSGENIAGLHDLDLPIEFELPLTFGKFEDAIRNQMAGRMSILTNFTLGLVHFFAENSDLALEHFEAAIAGRKTANLAEKEVFYLFAGSALMQRKHTGDFDQAQVMYQKIVDINPDYARGYIGLGQIFYQESASVEPFDLEKLDQALAQYDKAMQARIKPPSAHVEEKVHLSRGNAYLIKAQAGSPEFFELARQEFEAILAAYDNDPALKGIAAEAYFGLGGFYQLTGNSARAAQFYWQSRQNTWRSEVRANANNHLDFVCSRLDWPPRPIAWLRWCRS